MNTPNEDRKQNDNMELLKQQASACDPGCGCHATASPGKTRWVIGAIVLVAAGVMVARAMIKTDATSTQPSATAFANPAASPTSPGMSGAATDSGAATAAVGTSLGTTLGAFSELNTVAAKTDAVFIFVPGKEGVSGSLPSAPMNGAMRLLESKGLKCCFFTLKPGSRDYDQITAQMAVPGVLALAKGRGMSAVSGDITEAKLVQGFVAACSPGGCGGGSCSPGAPGCK